MPKNKLTDFQSFVYSCSLDLIVITETWQIPQIYDNEILLIRYNIFRLQRENSQSGGVLVAVNHGNPSSLVLVSDQVELLSICTGFSTTVNVTCVYRSNCSAQYDSNLLEVLQKLSQLDNQLLRHYSSIS